VRMISPIFDYIFHASTVIPRISDEYCENASFNSGLVFFAIPIKSEIIQLGIDRNSYFMAIDRFSSS